MYRGCFDVLEQEQKVVLVRLVLDKEALWFHEAPIQENDRHVAYYEALHELVKEVVQRGISEIRFEGVDDLVAKQVEGKWKVTKPRLSRLCVEIRSYLPEISRWGFSLC